MVRGTQIAEKARIPLQEQWGYIWGKSGQLLTREDWLQLVKEKAGNSNYDLAIKYGDRWIGHRVADCSGLIVWIAKQFGMTIAHGSNSIWKGYLSEKGKANSNIPTGALVFKLRNNTDYYHVGVYVGNGKVIEAKGTLSGVVETKLSDWGYYGLWKGIDYGVSEPPVEVRPLQKGDTAVVDVPNDGTLWVRKSPSSKADKKDAIREGDEVTILELSGDWAKVRYESEGYVMTKFLRG